MSDRPDEQETRVYDLERRIHGLTVDSVTKLLKKEGFIDAVKQRDSEVNKILNGPHATLLIDLDEFKFVNDTYGHAKGDKYLSEISGILDQYAWGEGDDVGFAFRAKEGDEVVVVLSISDERPEQYNGRILKFKLDVESALSILHKKLPEYGIDNKIPTISVGSVFNQRGLTDMPADKRLDTVFSTIDGGCDKALYEAKKTKADNLGYVSMVKFEDIQNV